MDFFGGVKCTENELRSWVKGGIQFKCLNSLDFHGQLHSKEFSQVSLLVIKLFPLSSKPTQLCSVLFSEAGAKSQLVCLASFALLDSANRECVRVSVRMVEGEETYPHLLPVSVSIVHLRILHHGIDICFLKDISTS